MGQINNVFQIILIISMVVLAILVIFAFVCAIKGPRVTDRIVAVSMIETMSIMIICILAVLLQESYLFDVAILYAMVSFLSVVVLCKVFLHVYQKKEQIPLVKTEGKETIEKIQVVQMIREGEEEC